MDRNLVAKKLDEVQRRVEDLERFAHEVAAWLRRRPANQPGPSPKS
ncbi:MAG: hypothetical protein U0002_17970 [Thermoanaerobaculia bacterium]